MKRGKVVQDVDRNVRWFSRYEIKKAIKSVAPDVQYTYESYEPKQYHYYGPAGRGRTAGFIRPKAGDDLVVFNLADLQPVTMTDEEAFTYHEGQMLRHQALAIAAEDRLRPGRSKVQG